MTNNPNLKQPNIDRLAEAMNKYLVPYVQNTPRSQLNLPEHMKRDKPAKPA